MLGPMMISAGVVLLALALCPLGRRLTSVDADDLQPLEILETWGPASTSSSGRTIPAAGNDPARRLGHRSVASRLRSEAQARDGSAASRRVGRS